MSARMKGLGRGLDALIAEPPPEEAVTSLPLDRLRPNRLQPRTTFDEPALAELAESIRAQGVVQPIVVTPGEDGRYVIVAGERRWRAAQQAGLTEMPVVVREVADERELLELALVENLQRSDLNPIEEALAFQALAEELGHSQEEIARRVGKARATISNSLRLLNLTAEVQALLRSGKLTAGQARPLLALSRPADQVALAERAAREGLSARQLEALVAAPAAATKRRQSPAPDVHAAAAAERLTRRLQTRVEIRKRRRGGGVVEIHFHSEEELMRLFDWLVDGGET